jgi:hypothetical protein
MWTSIVAFEDDGVFADGGVHELGAGEGSVHPFRQIPKTTTNPGFSWLRNMHRSRELRERIANSFVAACHGACCKMRAYGPMAGPRRVTGE